MRGILRVGALGRSSAVLDWGPRRHLRSRVSMGQIRWALGWGRVVIEHDFLSTGSESGVEKEVRGRAGEDHDGGPHIQSEPQDVVRLHRVDSKGLDPASTGRVAHYIEGERPAVAKPVLTVGPDDESRYSQIPDGLLEVGGMEGLIRLISVGPMCPVDGQAPRQVRGFPE